MSLLVGRCRSQRLCRPASLIILIKYLPSGEMDASCEFSVFVSSEILKLSNGIARCR